MKYAVAAMNFFDNELTIKIVHADNWRMALSQHPVMMSDGDEFGDITWLPEDIDDAKEDAFSADISFDVIELED